MHASAACLSNILPGIRGCLLVAAHLPAFHCELYNHGEGILVPVVTDTKATKAVQFA